MGNKSPETNIENNNNFNGNINKIEKEGHFKERPESLSISKNEKIIEQMAKSICLIDKNNFTGTGFICIIPFPDKINRLPVLITCNHVLGQNDLLQGKTIKLFFNGKEKILNIDYPRKIYTNPKDDATIIELKKGEYKDEDLLEVDNDVFKECQLNDKYKNSVYIIHYPYGKEASLSIDIIKGIDIDNKNIKHLCSTAEGSSGAPILNLDTCGVIGIHYGKDNYNQYNCGLVIKVPINDFYNLYQQQLSIKEFR